MSEKKNLFLGKCFLEASFSSNMVTWSLDANFKNDC